MIWVHCNVCLLPFDAQTCGFFVTNCGHIFCEGCLEAGTRQKCSVCSNPNVKVAALDSSLRPEVKAVFADASSMTKTMVKSLEFQLFHYKQAVLSEKKRSENVGSQMR